MINISQSYCNFPFSFFLKKGQVFPPSDREKWFNITNAALSTYHDVDRPTVSNKANLPCITFPLVFTHVPPYKHIESRLIFTMKVTFSVFVPPCNYLGVGHSHANTSLNIIEEFAIYYLIYRSRDYTWVIMLIQF